jgi:hypothetical protein
MPIQLARHENPRMDALTDAGRLRWVLEFSRRDLEALPSEVLEALGDDLRHATAPWWVQQRRCTAMPAAQVRALQQEIHEGIQAVLGESIPFEETVMISLGHKHTPSGGWALPVAATHLVRVRLDSHGRDIRIWRVGESTDERTAILEGLANLIVKFGERLCTCPVCGTPFLRQYRQAYCKVRCSNKVRNRRRLDQQTAHRAQDRPRRTRQQTARAKV